MRAPDIAALALAVVALLLSYLRWLRVAQREHYLVGMTYVFAKRWWGSSGINVVLFALGAAGAVASLEYPLAAFAAALGAGVGPLGLGVRAKTSRLAWTARMKRLGA
ncbi:MAG: hypothetical protein M1435_01560, partial [Actinobacteria bacterium]|nr:hypothetical protein [Actinomycetota bacterium]